MMFPAKVQPVSDGPCERHRLANCFLCSMTGGGGGGVHFAATAAARAPEPAPQAMMSATGGVSVAPTPGGGGGLTSALYSKTGPQMSTTASKVEPPNSLDMLVGGGGTNI